MYQLRAERRDAGDSGPYLLSVEIERGQSGNKQGPVRSVCRTFWVSINAKIGRKKNLLANIKNHWFLIKFPNAGYKIGFRPSHNRADEVGFCVSAPHLRVPA